MPEFALSSYFLGLVTGDLLSVGLPQRFPDSTERILGTKAGTFVNRGINYKPKLLIYIDLHRINGGERGIIHHRLRR